MPKKPAPVVPPDPVLVVFLDQDNDYLFRVYASETDYRAHNTPLYHDWCAQGSHVVRELRSNVRKQFDLLGGKDRITPVIDALKPEHTADSPMVLTTTVNPVATHLVVPETSENGQVNYSDFLFF